MASKENKPFRRKKLTKYQMIMSNESKSIFSLKGLILLYIMLLINTKQTNINNILSYFSNITIRISGPGTHVIFNTEFYNRPNYIYINDIKQDYVINNYNFIKNENIIKLVWNNEFSNCNNLFKDVSNITFVDLTYFDFDSGLSANNMFSGCTLLTSVTFPLTRTITLTDCGSMFYNCISLTSVDVSTFETASVRDFSNMFKNCESLISLNLYNFITTDSLYINSMFQNCKNLIYLNIGMAHFDHATNRDNFFSGIKNIVICETCVFISNIISGNYCITTDCSTNWKAYLRKYDNQNNQCTTTQCKNLYYKYDYNSKCYDICPNRTYNNN